MPIVSHNHKSVLAKIKSPKDMKHLSLAQLQQLSDELRNDVIEIVSQTGGHLGSSLGVIELTVALHHIFDAPRDKIIWDVGHQCYPHKILTGRRHQMTKLRQTGGPSGFTKRSESPYDPFGAAHSSTSISAALGFAAARDLGQDVGDTVAVIGDGSISAGMAYEALNNAGSAGKRLFVILNDNDMSIAPPVGAMSKYLSGLDGNTPLHKLNDLAQDMESLLPKPLRLGAKRTREIVTGRPDKATLFEDLGFDYIGPIDGHDMGQLLAALRRARAQSRGPVLIHALTRKGKGYAPAENAADKYHGVSKFDVETGNQFKSPANAPSYTSVFAKALVAEAQADPRVVAVTAAMPSGTGVDKLQQIAPNRVFDVGIAEQHAVTFAAGMAAGGLKPFCAIYSTFLQRGYDQIVHDVALQGLPVRFAIDRAGLVGADGATHAGSFDISYLIPLPGFVVMAAADEAELMHMVATAAAYDDGPIAFRYPRGSGRGCELPDKGSILPIGKGRIISHGDDVAILSFGAHLDQAEQAKVILAEQGISVTIADARFAKPLDADLIDTLVQNHDVVMTLEQGGSGGFGAAVLEYLAHSNQLALATILPMTLPDRFIDQGSADEMYNAAGMSAAQISDRLQSLYLARQSQNPVDQTKQDVG